MEKTNAMRMLDQKKIKYEAGYYDAENGYDYEYSYDDSY